MCDENGEHAAEFLCEDGLVFDTISQQCGLPFKVGCEQSGRLLLQLADPVRSFEDKALLCISSI